MHIQLPPELVNQLVEIVVMLIGAAVVAITRPVLLKAHAYLEAKLGAENFNYARDFTATVVRALEQSPVYKDFDPAKKKEVAVAQIVAFCNEHGLPVTVETVDKMIEAAVQEMNAELDPFKGTPLPMGN